MLCTFLKKNNSPTCLAQASPHKKKQSTCLGTILSTWHHHKSLLMRKLFFSHCVVYLKEKMCHIKICSEVFFLVEDERMRRQETLMRANIQTGFTFNGRITISENSTYSQRFQTADFFKYNTVLPPSGHFDLNLFTLFFITPVQKRKRKKKTKPFSQLTINQ